MVTQLGITSIKQDDIITYYSTINNSTIEFNIVEFHGIKEFNDYRDETDDDILGPLSAMNPKLVVGYDWDFHKKSDEQIDLKLLMRVIEYIGKEYVMKNWPDVIFYEAEDKRLHRIYERMFPSFGYNLLYSIGDNYIYTKSGRDNIKITTKDQ